MHVGEHLAYQWFEAKLFNLHDLLALVPECVIGRFVAVSSFDSGALKLSPAEEGAGWVCYGDLAISPQVESADSLPYAECDEWFVLTDRTFFSVPDRFMSYDDFTLRSPEFLLEGADQTWDHQLIHADLNRLKRLQDSFWVSMVSSDVESYIGSGNSLIFVTRNAELYSAVLRMAQQFEDAA
jgi:hypothetical protein